MTLAALLLATPSFRIHVVDADSGRGVPLVELRTVNGLRLLTDSEGNVAFDEPGLMEGEVYVHVRSHGYALPADGFGYRGVRLKPRAGGETTIRLPRLNVAERLPRLTGAGIYRDTVRLGLPTPLKRPLLNGGVMGQDTAQAEIYRGKMMWFWGDTDRASYPLGNFATTGAIATLPNGGPDQGIDYAYFAGNDGFVRPMVEIKAPGPIWISGLAVLGRGKDEALYAHFTRMKGLGEVVESGILRWNDAALRFDVAQTFPAARGWRFIDDHTVQDGGFLYGRNPAAVRVPANAKALFDPAAYEAYTPLGPDGKVLRRDGIPQYRWQRELPPITSEIESRLVSQGDLKADETHFLPRDAAGDLNVIANGSVHWNAFRGRWIGIFARKFGRDAFLGEIVYSESDALTGPFRRAVKVVTHDRYTFYNPVHHAFLDRGSVIYFEGTYTAEFSGNDDKTPLYNYNQILYRLDLSDPRLAPAQGIADR